MNRKGFTLIEVLAVIIIMGIILVIAVPSLGNVYNNSKIKSEEIFIERLSQTIDSYVKLNGSNIGFTSDGEATKTEEGSSYKVTISKGTISIKNIIDDNLLSKENYVNAGNKGVSCNANDEIIEVYKDSDYVYCYKVKKDSLGCLTTEYQNTITGEYAIDTCIWSR